VSSPRASVPDLVSPVAHRLFKDQSSVDLGFEANDPVATEQVADMVAWANCRPNGMHGKTMVRAWTPDLPGVSYSVIEIVTDDMPFLVDSVTSELTREGRAIQLLAHPLFAVTRDNAHQLTAVHDLDVNEIENRMTAESWMRIHVERNFISDNLVELVAGVERVLDDVRKCVNDWSSMRTKAIDVAGDLRRAPPLGIDPDELDESIAFIEWLTQESFTFIGYREYDLVEQGGQDALRPVPGSGLGILRQSPDEKLSKSFEILPPAVRAKAREKTVLVLSKANSRSTVHRPAYLDYVGIKKFDSQGNVIGERRFLGLFAARAYSNRVTDIPVLRSKYLSVERNLDYVTGSHSAKDLEEFLNTYPRDELFQMDVDHLTQIAKSVLKLQERRQTKLYIRYDPYERFVSALIYFPRDRYTTAVRLGLEGILRAAFGGASVDYSAHVSESVLARLHYVIHLPSGVSIVRPDLEELEARLTSASRSWMDEYQSLVLAGEHSELIPVYADAFPESYKEDFDPSVGVQDALIIEQLEPGELALSLYAPVASDSRELRFKVIRVGPEMPLTKILPILERLGVEVLDEHPYEITRNDRAPAWILDFGLVLPKGEIYGAETLFTRFESAFESAWHGQIASDVFNALVTRAGLTWQDAKLIRAYARYIRQIGSTFGQDYIESVIVGNVEITRLLIEFFRVRFDPAFTGDRENESDTAREQFEALLSQVPSLDHDRILRLFWNLFEATVRTNYFTGVQTLAFKLVPTMINDIPLPKPAHEIWVYSPRVEGVHLRFGAVARGGLRWSDRREDFRTEILGLVKAQEVKNAVIVPAGAKGGFFAKHPPDPAVDREAWMNEGIGAYQDFIRALLSVTDNIVDSVVIPPIGVVRHDLDDPYLVVAADKGTASFSDIANAIAMEENFWLGDAFASGGSAGYDHKSMAITALGAWESVKRHFFEMNIDTQRQDFTVIGIGDMSGDVFGNGMLLSEHIRLIAAFDHRDIFVDPSPNAASSFVERKRLAELPRSSWADYNAELISDGGGVFSRSAKSIALTQEIKDALDFNIEAGSCTPDQLINAILKAPAQLLWNGGIGTYVKASTETNVDVGDRANDSIRVNGGELRVQVVGEGGNLGMTQLGRVEAARSGVRLNTDAIDNSAGVDTSDHEVNLKILFAPLIASGALTMEKRDELLHSMTESVATLVLADNFNQNVVLSNARAGSVRLLQVHQRMIRELERRGLFSRALEYLPDDAELETRRLAGEGLTSPELAVLLAYAKIEVTKELNAVGLGNDPWCDQIVIEYFPGEIRDRYREEIKSHLLRSEIANTVMANELINIGGVTFVFRAIEETGSSTVEVVKAAFAAMEVFGIRDLWRWINTLPADVPASARTVLHLEVRRLLDRSARWFLQNRGSGIELESEISTFKNIVAQYAGGVPRALKGQESERFERLSARFVDAGAPKELADRAASGLDVFTLLDITKLAGSLNADMTEVIGLYFSLSERFDIDRLLVRISALPRGDRWTSLARQALRSDLYSVIAELTGRVYRGTQGGEVTTRISQWEEQRTEGIARTRATLDEILQVEEADLATLSVGLRVLRNLAAQAG
jgi:glutamate dehydrogenase